MMSPKSFSIAITCLFIVCSSFWCNGEKVDTGTAPMESTEQEALYSTIQGFVGNWWNGSDLYPDPCGWTPIQGVSCDIFSGLWYVTALNIGPIHDNSLECAQKVEFRPHLFQLKHLTTLSFFNCFSSPHKHPMNIESKNWEELHSLESLEFRSNPGLTGQIPYSFGSLTKLQSLVLLENGLIGEIPQNIGNLSRLKRLVLAENHFNGKIPDSVEGFKDMLIMDLSSNALSGSLPMSLGGLTSLLKLDLSNNLLEGKLPSEMRNLKNLTLLDLRSNKISGGLVPPFEEMDSLEELILSNNPIGGDLISIDWEKMHKLVILDLSSTGLTGEIPESISELKSLRFLGLNNNSLTGILSPKLAALPCISAIYVNGNNLTGMLKFSESFYGKMGRRFSAWNNPNLCCPSDIMSTSHVPFGVKSCQQEVKFSDLDSSTTKLEKGNVNQNSHFTASSMGFSSHAIGGLRWVFMVEIMMMILLMNFFC